MKRLLLLTTMVLCVGVFSYAQTTVSGTVVDEAGDPLIGANILAKGTSAGAITDFDGNYELEVPDGSEILIFSYTGFETKEVEMDGRTEIDVVLVSGQLLEEIVVTSTGLKRNARNVVYANQTVGSEDLNSTPNKNALEALRGKAAGVKITTGSGSVGASSRIVLRGEGSLTGNNNALIVIDGIPVDNASSRGGDGTAQNGYADYGNRFNDLNPDDIESITVLKGPSATSLYGSRGASGVLVITTKKGGGGEDGNVEIGVKSSYSVQDAYVLLQRQDQFGQGYGTAHFDTGENWSWGPAFDGVERPWTSPVDTDGDGALEALVRPYSAVPDQIENFFRQGNTLNNSIYFSGAKGDFTYYASYARVGQDGIMDNTRYDRNTFNVKASAKLTDRLTTDFGVNFSTTKLNTATEGYRPFEGLNAYANAIQAPVNIPYNEIRDYTSPFHDLDGFYGSYAINPYFILNEYQSQGKFKNLLANFSLTYNLLEGLDVIGRIGMNSVNRDIDESIPRFAYSSHLIWGDDFTLSSRGGRHNSPGEYSNLEGNNVNLDVTTMLNYDRALTEDGKWTLNATAGYNLFERTTQWVEGSTIGGLVVPGWYNLSNSVGQPTSSEASSRYRLYGIYGNASIGFNNAVFLEYSARNDWSSTLPPENNSFFYQAVGGSVVLTDLLNMQDNDFLSFLKLRGSVGTTGKDAGLYLLRSSFIGNPIFQPLAGGHDLTFPLNGQSGFTVSNTIGNPNLRPELTTTYEFGADLGLFDNKINIEYTWYNSVHTDQIVEISLPASTGFTLTTSNIGEMTNKGHELAVNLKPIDGVVQDLYWDVDLIYSKNVNEVVSISDESDELVTGGPYTNASVSVVAKEGLPFGTFKSATASRTDAGEVIVGAGGLPVLTPDEQYFGSYQPDWTASASTRLRYKGIGFNILFDYRKGGVFFSTTKDQLEFNGTALSTLVNNREPFVIPNSVVEDESGNYVPNETEVTAEDIYAISGTAWGGNSLLIDATFLKLREIGLSYTLPKNLLGAAPISDVTVSLFAHNLKFWLPDENTYADPEIGGPTLNGNAAGVETSQTPPSKSYGINLSLTF